MPTKFATIDEFFDAQPPERLAEVLWLRSVVFEAEPDVVETIKWNSPNYVLTGADRLTINAAGKGPVRLILHFGTERPEDKHAAPTFTADTERLLTWHSDIRASLPAPPAAKRARQRIALISVVRAWLVQP